MLPTVIGFVTLGRCLVMTDILASRTRILKERTQIMTTPDWSQCPAVESIPGKVSGAWVLRGTRTPVKVLFENLEAGMSIEEVIEQFPVSREEIDSLMAFVAHSLDKEPTFS
jgi:uncharacterized protein (DUF433 family)